MKSKKNSIYKAQKEQIHYSKNGERWEYSHVPFCRGLIENGQTKEETEKDYEDIKKLVEEQVETQKAGLENNNDVSTTPIKTSSKKLKAIYQAEQEYFLNYSAKSQTR